MKKAELAKRVRRMEGQLEEQGRQIAELHLALGMAGAVLVSAAHADAPGSASAAR